MNREEFARVERVFQLARHLQGEARAAIVAAEVGEDMDLRAEIETLLAAYDRDDDALLDRSPVAPQFSLAASHDGLPEISGYRVLSILGEGGMGTVYLAQQDHPSRRVALKIVRGVIRSEERLRRFRREAEVLGQLHHPGIAQVFAAGEERGVPFIAMEYVEGATLLKFVDNAGLDRHARLQLFCRVADAVHHAHLRGVIHRDLKPTNILVEGTWPKAWPKVLDFGVARVVSDDALTAQTRAGDVLGTLEYMSPEQACGDPAQLDERTDVYALGVILFELLAGRRPHDLAAKPMVEAARILHDEDPARLASVDRSLRGPLDAVTATALARERADRYPSVPALVEDVRRYLKNEPVSAASANAVDVARRFARRHRSLLVGAAAVALSSTLGFAAALWQWRVALVARDAERHAKETAERRFGDLRGLARSFVFEFHDRIEDLPGSLSARQFLVSTGLDYLDRLATEASLDDGLARELAGAYARLGDIQGAPAQRNLGDVAGAIGSYQRALDLLGGLDDPNAQGALEDRYEVLLRRGDVFAEQGNGERALQEYRQCEPLLERLSVGARRSERRVGTLASRVGTALLGLGRGEEARASFAVALRESQARYEVSDSSEQDTRDYATDQFKLALCDLSEGEATDALRGFERYFDLVSRLAKSNPGDPGHRRDQSVGHERIADALIALGRDEEALEHYRVAVGLTAATAEEDRADQRSRLDHCGYLVRLGELQLGAGDLAGAEGSFVLALQVASDLAATAPDQTRPRRRRAVAQYKMAELARARRGAPGLSPEQRQSFLEEELEWLSKSRASLASMREAGLLLPSDRSAVEEVDAELTAIHDALSRQASE